MVKVFCAPKWRLLLSYILAGVMALTALYCPWQIFKIAVFLPPSQRSLSYLGVIFLEIVSWLAVITIIKAAKKLRLEISEEGVIFYQWGYTLSASWPEVVAAEKATRKQAKRKSLILPVKSLKASKVVRILMNTGAKCHKIPLVLFDMKWQQNEIGALIKHYAPDVLND